MTKSKMSTLTMPAACPAPPRFICVALGVSDVKFRDAGKTFGADGKTRAMI
jgi:hypothetical protein